MNKTDQNLKDSIGSNENSALWCAGSVVFGLCLEVIFAVWFHEPPSPIARWGPVVADIIIALGVAGEVMFGRKARLDSEELTRRSEERLAEATTSAAKANERAIESELRLTLLRRQVDPRQINDEDAFVDELNSAPHKPRIVFIDFSEDAWDGYFLGIQLQRTLQKAEWAFQLRKISRDDRVFSVPPPLTPGEVDRLDACVKVHFCSRPSLPPGQQPSLVLLHALTKQLGTCGAQGDGFLSDGEIRLVIYPKL